MGDRVDVAVTHHHLGPAVEDWLDQQRDVGAGVLVVGVRVDDDVGSQLQTSIHPGLESGRKPAVIRQLDDVIDSVPDRHIDGAVG